MPLTFYSCSPGLYLPSLSPRQGPVPTMFVHMGQSFRKFKHISTSITLCYFYDCIDLGMNTRLCVVFYRQHNKMLCKLKSYFLGRSGTLTDKSDSCSSLPHSIWQNSSSALGWKYLGLFRLLWYHQVSSSVPVAHIYRVTQTSYPSVQPRKHTNLL